MRSSVRFLVAAVAGLLLSGGAGAATIEVLSAGAVEPGLLPAAEAFRRETGHEARIRFATAPAIRQWVGGGETLDLVIAPPAVLDDLAKLRRVDGDARVPIGKVGVGATVREGAPQPDLRTVEALKRAVLGAETVVYNRASTGLYLEKLFERLGVAEAIAARSVRYPDGASVLEHVARGTGREIGFGAITEIMLFRDKGLRLVGPLPGEVQNYTTYAAAPAAGAANAEAARAFVRFLGGPAGRAIFAAHGVE
jgi:molybdate transport system substrate-binding protein